MRRRKRRIDARLTAAQVRAAFRLYVAGWSVREIAEAGWEAWGMASVESAKRSLRHAFRIEGLPLRTYRQAARVRVARRPREARRHVWHGEGFCQGRVRTYLPAANGGSARLGQSCQRRVKRGERYCAQHDPNRREERAERMARVRAARQRDADAAPCR